MASSITKPKIFSSLFVISPSSTSQPSKSKNSLSFLDNASNSRPIRTLISPNNHVSQRSCPIKSVLEAATATLATAIDKKPQNDTASEFPRPRILVSEKLGEAGLEVLRGFGDVECAYELSPDELCAKISVCDALIVRSGTKVSRRVFEAAKGKLKVVGRAGVGIDNVDLAAATEFGCLVVNAPTANTVAAAEHGIALLAAMARNVAQADASIKAGNYLIYHYSLLLFLFYIIIDFVENYVVM